MTFADSFILVISCALATHFLSLSYISFADGRNLLAEPSKRGAHYAPVVTGGGVVIALVFLVASTVALLNGKLETAVAYALLGPIVVAIIGFFDDLFPLNVLLRTAGYVLASSWTIYWIGFPVISVGVAEINLGWVGLLFGVVSLVWMQNLYNFMDGIDGLAISEAAFVFTSVVLLSGGAHLDGSWDLVLLILLGSCLGFLSLNLPDARLFLGDAGSAFLGLILGVLVLANTSVTLWSWLILLAFFITDASLTVLVRLLRGDKIYIAHSLHAYQHLNRRIGKRETLLAVVLINILWLLPMAFFAENWPDYGLFFFLVACLPLLVFQGFCGSGQIHPVWAVSTDLKTSLNPTTLQKRIALIVVDTIFLGFSLWLAVVLRNADLYKDITQFWWLFPSVSIVGTISLYYAGAYNTKSRLFKLSAVTPIIQAVSVSTIVVSLIAYLTSAFNFPRSAPFIFWFIAITVIAASRLLIRALFYGIYDDYVSRKPVAICGADSESVKFLIEYLDGKKYLPVAIVDNDSKTRKGTLHGIRIYDFTHIDRLVSEWGIVEFLYVESTVQADLLSEIQVELQSKSIPLVGIPMDLKEVTENDYLGEWPIERIGYKSDWIKDTELRRILLDRSVMLLGTSTLLRLAYLRTLLSCEPKQLILFFESLSELTETKKLVQANYPCETKLKFELFSYQDLTSAVEIAKREKVELVFQFTDFVDNDSIEANSLEFVRKHVLGTKAWVDHLNMPGVSNYILVSTMRSEFEGTFVAGCLGIIEAIASVHGMRGDATSIRSIRTAPPLTQESRWLADLAHSLSLGIPRRFKASEILAESRTADEIVRIVINSIKLELGSNVIEINGQNHEDKIKVANQLLQVATKHLVTSKSDLLQGGLTAAMLAEEFEHERQTNSSEPHGIDFSRSIEPTLDVALGLECSRELLESFFKKLEKAIVDRDESSVRSLIARSAHELKLSRATDDAVNGTKNGSNVSILRSKQTQRPEA